MESFDFITNTGLMKSLDHLQNANSMYLLTGIVSICNLGLLFVLLGKEKRPGGI